MTRRAAVPGVLALLLTIAATAAGATPCGPGGPAIDLPTFHGDARRLGWNAEERHLDPTRVGGPDFGPLWSSPALDAVTLDGRRHPAHLYATPLYVEDVRLTAGRHAGGRAALVFAASSSGWVHAVAAGCGEPALPPGAIAWATRLGSPVVVPGLDGGVPLGVLSTPTIDRAAIPPRLYVTALDAHYLFVTGAAKAAPASPAPVPPGLARLRVVTAPGAPAYLAVDAVEGRTTFWNPGPPVVTSAGPHDAVVWVLDSNQPRTAALAGPGAARPVLYAFDAATLALLWRSAPGALEVGGKYSAPTVARGRVFVGTDRIQAFGLRPR